MFMVFLIFRETILINFKLESNSLHGILRVGALLLSFSGEEQGLGHLFLLVDAVYYVHVGDAINVACEPFPRT